MLSAFILMVNTAL